ncbi:reverse transcriptase [Fusarium beomiforme]|uniref:Reverse transcriptase n=1 Tax=Fusarium beomiforme TaxID=44412 RepID=A0A9P5A8H8_9HYPO|nr:reverse transcriptase [Fusarium beomiforme]
MDAAKQIHLIAKGNKRPSPHPDKTSEKLSAVSSKIRQVFQVRSGWAVLTADSETRDFLVEKQAEWAAELGATTPTKRFWSLFGSSAARLIDKTDRPRQYSQFANIVCINCLGPHQANFRPQLEAQQSDDIASHEQPSIRGLSPAALGAPSCIMVATSPQAAYEAEEEPEHPRPALADSERYDIVLLQELWTAHTDSRSFTKTHPAYDTFTPVEMWDNNDTRPRVIIYVRRDPKLLADQIRPFQTRDILWLIINGMMIVNFYRQNDEHDALEILLQWPVPGRCLVAGDFNARHRSWQTGHATNRGQEIAAWSSENDLNLLNTLDIPINPYGNTIDLAFTNMPLAEATVEDHLTTSSDHFTLSLTLPDIRLALI